MGETTAGEGRRKSAERVAEEEEEDRISQLPSEVLSHILSFLSMKEAAGTSVLSKAWRRRWLFVDELDFDVDEVFGKEWHRQPAEKGKFVKWVSSVLHSHREATLEFDDDDTALMIKKLRIDIPLSNLFREDLDEWIAYAFARRVKCLELRVSRYEDHICFPSRFVEINFDCHVCFPSRLLKSNFDGLRSLSLVGVNVTGEDVESLLRKFSFLEYLELYGSEVLQWVEVCGSSLALKHLEILECTNLEFVVVRDTNLVSLTFTWLSIVVLENNPKLVDVRALKWDWLMFPRSILRQIFDCFSRVESLTLDVSYHDEAGVTDEVPELSELKQLTLIVEPDQKEALVRLTTLLSSSPKLEKLVLEFEGEPMLVEHVRDYEEEIKSGRGPKLPLRHLKAVEVRSYLGGVAEDGILMYFFAHTQAPIEGVTFDPHNLRRHLPTKPRCIWKRVSVEKRVETLRRVIPSSVALTVIELP